MPHISEQEKEASELFLMNFVGRIIENMHPQLEVIQPNLEKIHQAQEFQKSLNIQVSETEEKPLNIPPLMTKKEETITALPSPQRNPAEPIKISSFQPRIPQKIFSPVPMNASEKIKALLRNPAVTSVECSGPGKSLVVHEFNMLKSTQIILTKEEIDNILEDISKRTKIPLIKGVFKAAVDNIHISAIISDLAGSRFLIEKIPPMHKLVPMQITNQQRVF